MGEPNGSETLDRHDHVLLSLVFSLQAGAMQQLGKLVDPATGQVARDLAQARATIDVLEMLKAKCAGNLPREVARILSTAVMELQMNWLDEVKRDRAAAGGDGPAAAPPPGGGPAAPGGSAEGDDA